MAYNFDGKDKDDKDKGADKGNLEKGEKGKEGGEDLGEMMDAMAMPDMSPAPGGETALDESMESPAASEAVETIGASGQPGELLAEKLGLSTEEGAALYDLSQTINKYQGMSEEELAERLLKNPYERNELEIKLARESGKPKPEDEAGMGGMGAEGGEMGGMDPLAALGS